MLTQLLPSMLLVVQQCPIICMLIILEQTMRPSRRNNLEYRTVRSIFRIFLALMRNMLPSLMDPQ
jgi:hypothetical protein